MTDQAKNESDENKIDLRTTEGVLACLERVIDAYRTIADTVEPQSKPHEDAMFLLNGLECARSELVGSAESVKLLADQLAEARAVADRLKHSGEYPSMALEVELSRGRLRDVVPLARLDNALRTIDWYAGNLKRTRTTLRVTGRAFLAAQKAHDGVNVELQVAKEELDRCQRLVAAMHAAAVGAVQGPTIGVVEDVADVRARLLSVSEKNEELLAELSRVQAQRDEAMRTLQALNTDVVNLRHAAAHVIGADGHRLVSIDVARRLVGEWDQASKDHDLERKVNRDLHARIDELEQRLAAANDERDRLAQRISATKGDVTKLSMELEASRDQVRDNASAKADLGNTLKTLDAVGSAAHGLLATLDDVQCPHGLAIRQTLAALTGYQGDAPVRVIVDDDAIPTFASVLAKFSDLSNRLQRLESMLSYGLTPGAPPPAVDDFDGITPIPSGNDGPRLRR